MSSASSGVIRLPTTKLPGTNLAPEWGPGDKLMVFQKHRLSSKQTRSNLSTDGSVCELKWRTDLFEEDASRAMISEAASLFEEIGVQYATTSEPLTTGNLVKTSRRYRAILHAALDRLRNRELWTTFHEIEMTWHLCEILFIDFHAPGVLINQLLSWVRWHYPELTTRAETVLAHRPAHEHPDYWEVIIGMVLRGQNENARTFLKLSPDARKKEEFTIVCQLLHEMPVFSVGQLTHEFDMRWQKWSDDCGDILRSGLFNSYEKLRTVVRILAGEESVFSELVTSQQHTHTWFQLMIAQLLFKDPFVKDKDLGSLSEEFITTHGSAADRGDRSTFDRVLLAAFSYDLMDVLREACYYADNWWFVSHFVDLLRQGNQLGNHQVEDGEKLRDSLVLDYADSLISHSSLWQVAVTYYDSCYENGRSRLQVLLDRVPVDNELKAMKIIDIANKRNLDTVTKSVSRVVAARWLNKKRYAQALLWAVRSDDARLCTHIANLFLDAYVATSSFPDTDVLTSLGSSMLVSERLTFLAKYYEFHQLKKEDLPVEAGSLLVSLISSHISPKSFLMTLLMDALPLLESKSLVLDSDQTVQVMASLEELLDSKLMLTIDKDAEKIFKQKEDKLRLALARNMARSFLV